MNDDHKSIATHLLGDVGPATDMGVEVPVSLSQRPAAEPPDGGGGALDAAILAAPATADGNAEQDRGQPEGSDMVRAILARTNVLWLAKAVMAGERTITPEQQIAMLAIADQYCSPTEKRLVQYGIGL